MDNFNELFNAFLKSMMEQQETGNSKPNTPFKMDVGTAAKKSAENAKRLYDAYAEAGFTQEQAFELVKIILTAKRN